MKKLKNPKIICGILFLISIFFFGATTFLKEASNIKNGFCEVIEDSNNNDVSNIEYLKNIHSGIVDQISKSYNEGLYKLNSLIDLYSVFQKGLGNTITNDIEFGSIILDNNGYLHFAEYIYDTAPYANNFIELNQYTKSLGIPLLYIQTPSKNLEGFTELPRGVYSHSNNNADNFLSIINNAGIDNLDLRDEIIKENLDREKLFYKTDHHWTTEAAFWAFTKTVNVLNEKYNFGLDPQKYYTNRENYNSVTYKDSFLGSQGRRMGKYYTFIDDYTYISPKFQTDYSRFYYNSKTTGTYENGNFEEALVEEDYLTNPDIRTNRHAAYFMNENPFDKITNNLVDNDKKVLVIKDSFALPYCAYLSTCLKEMEMIDLRSFDRKALKQYIATSNPDIIIFLYNTEAFSEITFGFN